MTVKVWGLIVGSVELQILIAILFLMFSVEDIISRKVPNVLILPAIALMLYTTHFWFGALVMFLIGSTLYANGFWRGGDVKLLTLVGACFGALNSILIFFIVIGLIHAYSYFFKREKLPCAPFVLTAIIPFLIAGNPMFGSA